MIRFAFLSAIFAVSWFMPAHGVEIIAHRGASADAPENSLPAMKLAWKQNADAVELDLWLSKDGKIIVFHDGDTKRFESAKRMISDLTLEEARQLDVGAWKGEDFRGVRVPALEEVLATIPGGKRAVIEIKCGPEILPEFVRVLRAVGRPAKETCVISFNYETLSQSKKLLPELEHQFLYGYKKDAKTGKFPELQPLIARAKEGGFDALSLNYEWPVDGKFAEEVKAAGLKLYVWTVNDASMVRKWIAAGVQGVTTDRPGWLRAELAGPPRLLPALDKKARQIRVVSYNILGGRNPDGKHDLHRVADVINALNPDLVALQEVDVKTKRFRGRDLPAELAKLTGMREFFAEALPLEGGSYGVGALSRLPVEKHAAHALPAVGKTEPRAAIELVCRVGEAAGAPVLRFFGTHLDHLRTEDSRLAQVAKLLEVTAAGDPAPALLAGDFNAEPGKSQALKNLSEKWALTWPEGRAPATWPAINSKVAIDHVYSSGPWKVMRAITALEAFPGDAGWKAKLEEASDHLPIVVELELRAQ